MHEFGRTRSDLAPLTSNFLSGRVSIIIPCYNSEEFIGDAIESALGQTWEDVEVIVVDDGSSDDSLRVISRYGDRVHCLSQQRGGAPAARNRGLMSASGEFIQFLDADDALLADSIRRRLEAFPNDGVDAVFGDLEFCDSRLDRVLSTTSHDDWPSNDPLAHLIGNNINTEGPLHRRRYLYAIGGFDEGLPCSQEFNLHIRLFLHGARFEYLPGVVARAREHAGQARIDNIPWFLDDPGLHLKIVDHHRQIINGVDKSLLSPAVREAFALILWSRGAIASRNGAFGVARSYFRNSKRYAARVRPQGSTVFRLCHALVGPFATTWLLYQKDRVFDLFRTSSGH
jgi:glycosyltransferase involved in cell wall biosynthesis